MNTLRERYWTKKYFSTNNKNYDAYLKLQTISTEMSEMILKRKNDYHRQLSDKLSYPETVCKSILVYF